jgi:hypothetical protein
MLKLTAVEVKRVLVVIQPSIREEAHSILEEETDFSGGNSVGIGFNFRF